ncbi:tubulin-like doman-containing protein [Rhodococcus gordoniae]|uniref:tubulin-like doman-containing protein n=1 Tax=Rhodococcus gordoniae TaxID=223392 RepID=UPI0020CF4F7B|nr:tubulin-like doman-containing protein [Rhodococcus gordoniae]UTT49870.1 tubulin-like doman-containing protein [Rhodococcus gordoniae]
MRRFLVVGCGGSGAVTLAYMMDQLRSDLAAVGIDKIPGGWQFVSVDVPTAPEAGPDGLGNVRDQGGYYFGSGPQGDSYAVLDNALSNQLGARNSLHEIATWAPRDPSAVTVPIGSGAGQYRALGRMITLSKAGGIRDTLQQAWDQLFTVQTATEMSAMKIPGGGSFEQEESPIVLVVSSMAGGAGASMALDICRLLTLIPKLDPRLMGVFMVAPDIFDGLGRSATTGVRANALAMLGEIVASQLGSAREHDVEILRALGQQAGEGEKVPFARVFPVGRRVGVEGAPFGDGSQKAIYRGLARGLAGMMMSGAATRQFVQYDLTNGAGLSGQRENIGWGGQWDNLPWGTYGFSSLSMGRDRYAEYSAQRLARSTVDRLLDGHRNAASVASDEDQVNAILDSQWQTLLTNMGLPVMQNNPAGAQVGVGPWLTDSVLPSAEAQRMARQIVETELRAYLPSGSGLSASQWVPEVRRALAARRQALVNSAEQHALGHAFQWHRGLAQRIEQQVAKAVADLGLPYATAVVNRLSILVKDQIRAGAEELSRHTPEDITVQSADTLQMLSALKGNIESDADLLERVISSCSNNVYRQLYASLSGKVSEVAAALVPEILKPLLDALNESQTALRKARSKPASDVGLARLATDQYGAWPADKSDRVPKRFAEANNEVMLTPSADFMDQYRSDLPLAVASDGLGTPPFEESVKRAVAEVVTGIWATIDGSRPPGEEHPLLERTSAWRTRAFPFDPGTREALVPSAARFDVHVRPAELLERARQFVARTGESFDRFCRVSLREYIEDITVPEYALDERRERLRSKFVEALSLARPLASVNQQALEALHPGQQIEYRYKFTSIPFLNLPVADALSQVLQKNPMIDHETRSGFVRLLSEEDKLTRIDIFGSYPNYSPLAYDSVLAPAAKQWADSTPAQQEAFWQWRRARPLAASLPMHESERRAMTAGWFLGLVTGRLRLPSEPYDEPVRVWDGATSSWVDFPNPLLTPPARFLANNDWLPAVMESVLIAMARSHESPVMASMAPYRALRGIYDASAEKPASGILEVSAKSVLTDWLRTGDTGTGWQSQVADTGAGVSIDARAKNAIAWLTKVRDLTGQHYLAPGREGAPGGGVFSTITVREQASQTPIYRDIAADVYWATGELIALVEECKARAEQPEHVDTVTPAVNTATTSAQTFRIPDMGQF